MKLRQRPGDFAVRERLESALVPAGVLGLYRLAKRGVTTAAAVRDIAHRLRLSPRQIGVGGLKDTHAEAVQHLTFPGPSRKGLQGHGWRLDPVGRVSEALTPGATKGNAFEILVRDLSLEEAEAALARLPEVALAGVPNYFDSQRFGSLAGGRGFAAKDLIQGRYEPALKDLLTGTYRGQDRGEKARREGLASAWGDWSRLAGSLPSGEARAVACYLRDHPGAFSGALRCLAEGTRWQTLAAYQSHLFNEILGTHLRRLMPGGVDVEIRSGKLYFPLKIEPPALSSGREPLAPSSTGWPLPRRGVIAPAGINEDYRAVLQAEGIGMEDLRVAAARLTFPKGDRAPWVVPEDLKASAASPDELNPGRQTVTLAFALPPGSYATVVVKRLTYDAGHTFRA
jgi:tRNA pseudouridine13 synthase